MKLGGLYSLQNFEICLRKKVTADRKSPKMTYGLGSCSSPSSIDWISFIWSRWNLICVFFSSCPIGDFWNFRRNRIAMKLNVCDFLIIPHVSLRYSRFTKIKGSDLSEKEKRAYPYLKSLQLQKKLDPPARTQ